jgi:myo-inositol 2-dehydrogenase / D-chiro-inositol 1-dehydrogenase
VAAVRIGLVGCGFAAEHRHLPTLVGLSELSVEAVCDRDDAARTRVGDRFGVAHRYADARELAADPAVDAVAVCVPTGAHAEVALAALDAGKHLFVEKPLALSLDDADAMIERHRDSGVQAVVGFNLRSHRVARAAREVISSGTIGSVGSVTTAFADARFSMPDLPAWRMRREHGGGALIDKAIHHLDLLSFLLCERIEEVFAFGHAGRGDDETVVLSARMRGGALAALHASDDTVTRNELTLNGDRGSLRLDLYRSDGLELVGLDDLPGAPRTRLRRALAHGRQALANIGEIRGGGAFDASYAAEWRAFARCVRGEEPPACALEDGRHALQAALAAAHSITVGQAVRVAEAPPSPTPSGAVPVER